MRNQRRVKSDGTNRYLWETDRQWDLYILYADQRVKFGLEQRSLELLAKETEEPIEEVRKWAEQNSWDTRVAIFDKFWEPDVPTGIEAQIVEAEATHFELGALAANILGNRLATAPHMMTTNQLISLARLLPTVSRSQASITSEKP